MNIGSEAVTPLGYNTLTENRAYYCMKHMIFYSAIITETGEWEDFPGK